MKIFAPGECPACPIHKDENAHLRGLVKVLLEQIRDQAAATAAALMPPQAPVRPAPPVRTREKPNVLDETVEALRRQRQPAPLPGHEP